MTRQDVLLRRAYLRGWLDAFESLPKPTQGIKLTHGFEQSISIRTELASLEALKPCGECGGAGGMVEYGSFFPARRGGCNGTGIAPKKEKDRE